MALLEKFLVIRRSLIPNAGKGLFTKVDVPKGTVIVEYKGNLERWNDIKEDDGENSYIFKINNRWAVDALPLKKNFGRYANDARGSGRANGLRNNAEYIVKGLKVYIKSTRKIYAGGEICVDYGREYWQLDRKYAAEKLEAAKAKAKERAKNNAAKKTVAKKNKR